MSARAALMEQVSERLGNRQLVWSGIRGDDIEPLRDLPQLTASYSITGNFTGRADVTGVAYEQLSGRRIDPEIWDIDEHHDADATLEFRRGLLRALSAPSALLPYRPSSFLSAITFARQGRCLNLGLFGGQQAVFEHKPFVETSIARLGIPVIPWTYIADEDRLRASDLADVGPMVLRRSRTSGGEGILRVGSGEELIRRWPRVHESFVSVAPYIGDALPVNIGATVWPVPPDDDCVTVHQPSVQLIGIESCVTREFGYCGNDFGLARELRDSTLDQVEASTRTIGRWLRGNGYVGTFGVDYLVKDGIPLFTEINARFQGSTHMSCRLDIERSRPCLMLEHVAAWLDVPKPAHPSVREQVRDTPDLAHIIVHWTGGAPTQVDATTLYESVSQRVGDDMRGDMLVPGGVVSEPGSLVARLAIPRRITSTGFDLAAPIADGIRKWTADSLVQR